MISDDDNTTWGIARRRFLKQRKLLARVVTNMESLPFLSEYRLIIFRFLYSGRDEMYFIKRNPMRIILTDRCKVLGLFGLN